SEPSSVYQRAGTLTFSGRSAPPASSASTRTPALSVSRLASTEPAEPEPTRMKSNSFMAVLLRGPLGRRVQALVHEGRERHGVVEVRHIDNLAVLQAEVVGDFGLDRHACGVGGGDMRDDARLAAADHDVFRRVGEPGVAALHRADSPAQHADSLDMARQLLVNDDIGIEEGQPGVPVASI